MTFLYVSLGCKVNAYECTAIASILLSRGYKEDELNPDVVIINTCSVTSTADQKSRQHIRKYKTKFPNAIMVVMGCYAQKQHDFIRDNIKADIIVGTSNRSMLPTLIENFVLHKKQIDLTDSNSRAFSYEELGIASYSENVRAYLKIQDGCNNFCSYCLIPFVRGRMRSRKTEYILEEAKQLVKKGYKEIVLVGIHVGGFGQDNSGDTFSDLVEKLLDIPGLYRLRISSIEESEIDDKLIYLINTRDNLAKHFHIPLQSGSNNILRKMNRKYNCDEFYKKILKIKSACPDVALTTDVIVGFPQESDIEFEETYNFIIKCGFNMLHVFPFSPREGTIAAKMSGQVAPNQKSERVKKLMELSSRLWEEYTSKFVGKEFEILIEQQTKDGINIGRSSNYIEFFITDEVDLTGKILKVKYKKP